MTRILVTGGAGFIGANLCSALVRSDAIDTVSVLDDLSTGNKANIDGLGLDFTLGSILDGPLVADLIAASDTVVHLAALPSVPRSMSDPLASHHANVTGTLNVLEGCRKYGARLILASSSSIYGSSSKSAKNETALPAPRSPYAATKLAAEAYTRAYVESFNLGAIVFRFFNVYGPLQSAGHPYAAVVPTFINAALAGEPLLVHGDGSQTRDFTYVGTVAEILKRAAVDRTTSHEPINLAYGSQTSILELAKLVAQHSRPAARIEFVQSRNGDVRHSRADAKLVRSLFPSVDPIPFELGLRATLDWHLNSPSRL